MAAPDGCAARGGWRVGVAVAARGGGARTGNDFADYVQPADRGVAEVGGGVGPDTAAGEAVDAAGGGERGDEGSGDGGGGGGLSGLRGGGWKELRKRGNKEVRK